MYIKEFYNLIEEADLSNDEYNKLGIIIREASLRYLIKKTNGTLEEYLNFSIEGHYIEQFEFLNKIDITVNPTIYGKDIYVTSVTFPVKLFKNYDKRKTK